MKNTKKTIAALLQSKQENLIKAFIKGKENSFLASNSMLLDEYFQESFGRSTVGLELSVSKNPFALVALGGYGRKEQCIHSDVDILFLFDRKVPLEAEKLIQEIIYPIWDIGLDVGHCTRSISECIKLAREDLEVLTSLLDSRFLCGMSNLYSELNERLKIKVIRPKTNKIIYGITKELKKRHTRFGDSTYLLEPNLKEGQGGLRDYHTMLWVSRVLSELRTPEEFVYNGILSEDEYKNLSNALSFIFSVRNRLHYMADRKCDQLYFEYQTALAKDMKFKKEKGQMPVERFLGELHEQMEVIKQTSTILFDEINNSLSNKRKDRKQKKKHKDSRIFVYKKMLNFKSSEDVFKAPILLIRIFEESARLGIPISSESRRLITEFISLIHTNTLEPKQIKDALENILLTPSPKFNVLNEMLNTGMLTALIPEFKKIENRVQFDEYHLYPVDKHSLRTVQILKNFDEQKREDKKFLYVKIYKELSDNLIRLLWAALLHDIGKGKEGERHSIAGAKAVKKILMRMGYGAEDIDTVAFLVKEHLFLSKIATRRDTSDEETAIFCARKIKSVERLKMLYLLSIADAMATGPKAWNEWFASLLRDLFFKVLSILEKGELATEEAVDSIEKKKLNLKKLLEKKIGKKEFEFVISNMPPRYLLYNKKEDIVKHVELYQALGKNEYVWDIEQSKEENTRTITFCGKDKPGLFSKIAGVLTFNDIDILDAQIFTWRNTIALDILEVKPPPDKIYEDKIWAAAETNLKSAISGELELEDALKEKISLYQSELPPTAKRPHRVKIDNTSSSFYSIIEVFTYDYKGLLFKLTDALYKNNLDIWVAKIATKADQVVDVFYVRRVTGEKIDNGDEVKNIINSIEMVLLDDLGGQTRDDNVIMYR